MVPKPLVPSKYISQTIFPTLGSCRDEDAEQVSCGDESSNETSDEENQSEQTPEQSHNAARDTWNRKPKSRFSVPSLSGGQKKENNGQISTAKSHS